MKSDERRAAIVESAIRLFAEKGFRGTTTRELASALDVSEPVLYQHFRTKKDLYGAIIEAQACAAEGRAARFLALAETDDDRGFFTALGELVMEQFERDPDLMRLLMYSALERHELSDMFFDRVVVQFLKMVSGYIRRRVKSGAFRQVHPETTARGLIGMFHYHGMFRMLHPDRFGRMSRKRLVKQLVTIFLDGLSACPATK